MLGTHRMLEVIFPPKNYLEQLLRPEPPSYHDYQDLSRYLDDHQNIFVFYPNFQLIYPNFINCPVFFYYPRFILIFFQFYHNISVILILSQYFCYFDIITIFQLFWYYPNIIPILSWFLDPEGPGWVPWLRPIQYKHQKQREFSIVEVGKANNIQNITSNNQNIMSNILNITSNTMITL